MEWQEYLNNSVNDDRSKEYLERYSQNLQSNNFVVIFDFYHLSYLLNINPTALSKIVNATPRFYREIKIPKKSTGERLIKIPYPSLQYCQKWIKNEILNKIAASKNCFSYVKKKSIIDNASLHLNTTCLYKLDLENFFGFINIKRVIAIFRNCGYSPKVSYYLARICTFNGYLPQGACTSPQLSNIVCKRLDRRLQGVADISNLTYSRYADDLSFSGESISQEIRIFIKKIVRNEGFKTNDKKEKFINGKSKKKIITGLSITHDKIKITKKYKRDIKLEVFKFLKYNNGLDATKDGFDPFCKEKMIGRLNFWKMVEKNDSYIENLILKIRDKEQQYINNEL